MSGILETTDRTQESQEISPELSVLREIQNFVEENSQNSEINTPNLFRRISTSIDLEHSEIIINIDTSGYANTHNKSYTITQEIIDNIKEKFNVNPTLDTTQANTSNRFDDRITTEAYKIIISVY